MKIKKIAVQIAVCVFAVSLAGCAGIGKNASDGAEDAGKAGNTENTGSAGDTSPNAMQNSSQMEGAASDLSPKADTVYSEVNGTTWHENLSIIRKDTGKEMSINIFAPISVPEVSGMSVVEVEGLRTKEKKLTKKEKKYHGKSQKTWPHITDQEKSKIHDKIMSLTEDSKTDFVVSFGDDIEKYGYWDEIFLEPKNWNDVAPEQIKKVGGEIEKPSIWSLDESSLGENLSEESNQCGLTEEEAQKKAENFLNGLGFGGQILTKKYPFLWRKSEGDEETASALDGYMFEFAQGIDDVAFSSGGTEEKYYRFLLEEIGYVSLDGSEIQNEFSATHAYKDYSLANSSQILVTDKGVVYARMRAPLKILSVTKDVQMLPFEKIQKIVRDSMEEYMNVFFEQAKKTGIDRWKKAVNFSFGKMDLIYCRIQSEENKNLYTYVPAWRLWRGTQRSSEIDAYLLINAIDGSRIDLLEDKLE